MTNLTKEKHSFTTVLQDIKSVNKQKITEYLIAHFSPHIDYFTLGLSVFGKVKLSYMEMFASLDEMAH